MSDDLSILKPFLMAMADLQGDAARIYENDAKLFDGVGKADAAEARRTAAATSKRFARECVKLAAAISASPGHQGEGE